jgi:hypothetical protein
MAKKKAKKKVPKTKDESESPDPIVDEDEDSTEEVPQSVQDMDKPQEETEEEEVVVHDSEDEAESSDEQPDNASTEKKSYKTFIMRQSDIDGEVVSDDGYSRASEIMGMPIDQIQSGYRYEPSVGAYGSLVQNGHKPKSMRRQKKNVSSDSGQNRIVSKHFCPHCHKEIQME